VTCRDLDDFMSSGSGNWTQPEGYAEHLKACHRCRGLTRLLEEGGKGPVPSESQLRQIKMGMVENLQPVRPLPASRVFLALCAIIFLFVAAAGVLRLGTNGWEALNLWQRAGVFTSLGASAILLAGSMVRLMVPGSRHIVRPAALPVGILLALMLVIATAFRSHGELAFVANGLVCLKNGLAYSVPAALLFWLLLRRGAILSPKLIGAATGGLAGLIGLSVLEVNCPNLNIFHILVWHWGVVLISSLAGALVGAAAEYFDRPRNQMS
jgi:hypothetical protein